MLDRHGLDSPLRAALLADPDLRAALERYARRRVARDEVADLVQSTLVEALAADNTPPELEALRRYVFVVARNKVIDLRRRRATEVAAVAAVESAADDHDPVAVSELIQWLTRQVSRNEERATLEWMLREAEGHRLEHIAREAALPPPRVRKRVSRLRRLLRARWARHGWRSPTARAWRIARAQTEPGSASTPSRPSELGTATRCSADSATRSLAKPSSRVMPRSE